MPGRWPYTGGPGLIRPRLPTHAYHAAPTYTPSPYAPYGAPSPPPPYADYNGYYPTSPAPLYQPAPLHELSSSSTPSWDQAAFLQAMNNFSAQENSGTDWILDSSASSHMSA